MTAALGCNLMHLIYAGFSIFILTAIPLLVLGKSVGTDMIALGGGLLAMVLLITGATGALWRLLRGR